MSDNAQAPTPSASSTNRFDLNLVQVVDLVCSLVHQAFIRQSENKAKPLFKDLKAGKSLPMGELTITRKDKDGNAVGQMEVPLELSLDYSEFKGAGFGFPPFKAVLQAMLNHIGRVQKEKKSLNLLTSEDETSVVIHNPGIIRMGEQFNVMMLAIEPATKAGIKVQFMFVDPAQYPSLSEQKAQAADA